MFMPSALVFPRPIHAEPGVYLIKSAIVNDVARRLMGLPDYIHIVKIGATGDFDTRRFTVRGVAHDRIRDCEPYFDVRDWYLVRFRAFSEPAEAFEHERITHAALDADRLTLSEADMLNVACGAPGWTKSSAPELFKLSLADPVLLRHLPTDPSRAKRPRDHTDRPRRRAPNDF